MLSRQLARAAPALRTTTTTTSSVARRTLATAQVDPVHHTEANSQFLKDREAVKHHAEQTTRLWRNISYFVCVPVIIGGYFWVQSVEGEHEAHQKHLAEEAGGHLPEKPRYEYLNIRRKPFPWGNNSLFYNPHVQRDMDAKDEE